MYCFWNIFFFFFEKLAKLGFVRSCAAIWADWNYGHRLSLIHCWYFIATFHALWVITFGNLLFALFRCSLWWSGNKSSQKSFQMNLEKSFVWLSNKLYESSRRKPGWRFTAGFELKDNLKIFRVSFSYFEMCYVFVLQFGIFLIKFEWIDEGIQSESFQGRLDDQNIAPPKSRFWWHHRWIC